MKAVKLRNSANCIGRTASRSRATPKGRDRLGQQPLFSCSSYFLLTLILIGFSHGPSSQTRPAARTGNSSFILFEASRAWTNIAACCSAHCSVAHDSAQSTLQETCKHSDTGHETRLISSLPRQQLARLSLCSRDPAQAQARASARALQTALLLLARSQQDHRRHPRWPAALHQTNSPDYHSRTAPHPPPMPASTMDSSNLASAIRAPSTARHGHILSSLV